jgi:hypothetical protein
LRERVDDSRRKRVTIFGQAVSNGLQVAGNEVGMSLKRRPRTRVSRGKD